MVTGLILFSLTLLQSCHGFRYGSSQGLKSRRWGLNIAKEDKKNDIYSKDEETVETFLDEFANQYQNSPSPNWLEAAPTLMRGPDYGLGRVLGGQTSRNIRLSITNSMDILRDRLMDTINKNSGSSLVNIG